jgi:hypothetical protein
VNSDGVCLLDKPYNMSKRRLEEREGDGGARAESGTRESIEVRNRAFYGMTKV